MIWAICEDLGVEYSNAVVLYQSRFFEGSYPDENSRFRNVVYVDAVPGDRERSLKRMREAMLSRKDLIAAVFIGGMEGVEREFEMFRLFHPKGVVCPVASPGGAARDLAIRMGPPPGSSLDDVDYARVFGSLFGQGQRPPY